MALRILYVTDRLSPDRVHVQNIVSPDVLKAIADSGRLVMTVQDHRFFCPGWGKWTADGRACSTPMSPSTCRGCFADAGYFNRILGLTRRRLDQVARARSIVVLSEYMRRELVAVGCVAERIEVIPAFVWWGRDPTSRDLSVEQRESLRAGCPAAVIAGRLVAVKGPLDAIRAVARLAPGARPRVVAAGEGAEAPAVGALTADLGVTLCITGWADRRRMQGLLGAASVLVRSSLWQEPFGIMGLEALSLGTPVVAYDVGGIADWLGGPGGWLVPRGDVGGLSVALGAVLSDHA